MPLRDHLSPLAQANFRRFFLGQVVNTAGSSMAGIALAFAVLDIENSATVLGWVVAAWTVPMVAFMLLGGAVADRFPRDVVLRGCNLVQGAGQAVAAVLVLTGTAQVWHLVVLQAVSGTAFAASYPAFHGMVPILLRGEERKAGYVLLNQTESALRILGPALAGVLVAVASPGWALARGLGWVLPVALCSLVYNALTSGALNVLGPAIANDTIGSAGWGIAIACEALGLFLFSFVLTRIAFRRPLLVVQVGFLTTAGPMGVLALLVRTPVLAAAYLVVGCGMAALHLAWSLTVQEKVPEAMLSRIMAIDGFFSFVAMPLGQLAVGPVAHALGHTRTELLAAGLVLVTFLVSLTSRPLRNLRLEGPPVGAPAV